MKNAKILIRKLTLICVALGEGFEKLSQKYIHDDSGTKTGFVYIVVFEDQTGAKYHMNIIKVDSKGSKIEVSYGNRRAGEKELFECHTSLIEFLSAYENGLVGNNITNDNLDYSKLFNEMNVSISTVYALPSYLVEGGWGTG